MTKEKIHFIGSGLWSHKVSRLLESYGYMTEVHSAREFLARQNSKFMIAEDKQIYWITTTPEMQWKVVEKYRNSNDKFVLEKPLVSRNALEATALLDGASLRLCAGCRRGAEGGSVHAGQCGLCLEACWCLGTRRC
mgnify:CR=1 FL=1